MQITHKQADAVWVYLVAVDSYLNGNGIQIGKYLATALTAMANGIEPEVIAREINARKR